MYYFYHDTGYRYLYTEGKLAQVNYGKVAGYEDKKPYHVLAEGLAVASLPDEKKEFIPADIKYSDGNKYEFTERIHGSGRQGHMLYHLVLPKYCYVGEIVNNTTENMPIITRLNRQTLTAKDRYLRKKNLSN